MNNKLENVQGIIKAMTAYGGDCTDYEPYWSDENIALFREWLKKQPKVSGMLLYRGYTFHPSYFSDASISVGSVISEDALTQEYLPSFTTDMLRAASYINEYGEIWLSSAVRVLFVIKTHGRAFVDVSQYSYYPEECEYKCMSNVKLKVRAITPKGSFLQIELEEV